MSQRIYFVGTPKGIRLVRASVRSQALSHVAQSEFVIRVASQEDLVDCLSEGIKIESTREEQPELPLED